MFPFLRGMDMDQYKEMEYITKKSSEKVPFPGDKYSLESLEKMREAIQLYEKFHQDKTYYILFSDGTEIPFSIYERNLAHLLGINFSALSRTNFMKSMGQDRKGSSSFKLIKQMTSNPEATIKISGEFNHQLLNFYRIKARSDFFTNFADFSSFDYSCICFDEYESFKYGYETSMGSNYFLTKRNRHPLFPYSMMGINMTGDKSYVETFFPCKNELQKKMFFHQKIIYPIAITEKSSSSVIKSLATLNQKEKLITDISYLRKKYQSKLSHEYDMILTLILLVFGEEEMEKSKTKSLLVS